MSESHPESHFVTACFSVTARTEPGVLSRILELFAKRGLTPARFHAEWSDPSGDMLRAQIHMADMEPDLAIYIGECLRAIYSVDDVLVIEKRRRAAA